ncbi:MAG: hypothetical protein ACOX6E_01445 [Syntrophomonadaceae bacterium]|jgi:hypothetical protein
MLDLDFAFFNLNHAEKRGIMSRKYFLDRLAPVFFLPRVEKLIQLTGLNFQGCQISMPLGPGNLSLIELEKRQAIFQHTTKLVKEYHLTRMAVDRRLKEQLFELSNSFPVIFGDNFIKALATALISRILSRHVIKRIIMVGEMEDFPEFLSEIGEFGVPLSIQSMYPTRYEVMTYRLLYEKGNAVSTSALNPYSWGKGDLVFVFDPAQEELTMAYANACCYVRLTNNGCNLAPELEAKLSQNGLVNCLYNLAPIMETCMLEEAGFSVRGAERVNEGSHGRVFITLKQVGDEMGLWDLFLDKAI